MNFLVKKGMLAFLCFCMYDAVAQLTPKEIANFNALVSSAEANDTLKAEALGRLIDDSNLKGLPSESLKLQLYQVVERNSNPGKFGFYFARRSEHLSLEGNHYESVAQGRIAVRILRKYGTSEEYLSAVDKLCLTLISIKSIDETLELTNRTLAEYNNFPEGKIKSGVLSKRATGYLEKRKYRQAINDFKIALAGYRKDHFSNGEFFTYHQISRCYLEMNNPSMALEYLYKITIHPDFEAIPYTNKALVYDRIAFIYFKMKQYDKSIAYYKIAMAHCPTPNVSLMNQIKSNMAMTLFFSGDDLQAAKQVQELIGNGQNMNGYRKRDSYYVLGLCNFKTKDFSKAEDDFNIAIKTAMTIDSMGFGNAHNLDVIADSRKKLSLLKLNAHKVEESYELLEESYKAEKEKLAASKDVQLHKEVNTFELGEKKREVKKLTREQLQNRIMLQDQQFKLLLSLGGLAVALLIAVFTYRSYLLKKRNAKKLEEKKSLIEKQNRLLEASLSERNLLLKEIHHRVKNNFQMVISLLRIQAEEGENGDVNEFLSEATSRILSMGLVHQNLYQSEDLSAVNIKEYISDLAHYIINAHGGSEEGIELVMDIIDSTFDLQQAIPLGLILNEMMQNTMKHVHPIIRKTKIIMILQLNSMDQYELTYSDNGTLANKKKESRSFGTELISLLVLQLKGVLEIKMEPNFYYRINFQKTT